MQKLEIFIVLLSVFMLSCSNSKKAGKTSDAETTTNTEQPTPYLIASIERTACYGACPTYKAEVYSDGRVVYEGKMNVKRIGVYEATMSKEDREFIVKYGKEIDYFNMKDTYDGNITDLPGCTTYLNDGEMEKSIYNRYEGPDELEEFQKRFDKLLDSQEWLRVGSGEEEFIQDQD